MKDQTLAAVDEKLVKTGKFLENISSDPKKLQCLQHFAECQEVIQWLRDVTNGTWEFLLLILFLEAATLLVVQLTGRVSVHL